MITFSRNNQRTFDIFAKLCDYYINFWKGVLFNGRFTKEN